MLGCYLIGELGKCDKMVANISCNYTSSCGCGTFVISKNMINKGEVFALDSSCFGNNLNKPTSQC